MKVEPAVKVEGIVHQVLALAQEHHVADLVLGVFLHLHYMGVRLCGRNAELQHAYEEGSGQVVLSLEQALKQSIV